MRRQKRASYTNSDYEKMANLGDKDRFWQKWRVCQIIRVWPNIQMR